MRIGGVVEIITPEQGRMFGGQDREFVPVEDAVAVLLRPVAAFDQLFLLPLELFQLGLKCGLVHLAWTVVSEWVVGLDSFPSGIISRQRQHHAGNLLARLVHNLFFCKKNGASPPSAGCRLKNHARLCLLLGTVWRRPGGIQNQKCRLYLRLEKISIPARTVRVFAMSI